MFSLIHDTVNYRRIGKKCQLPLGQGEKGKKLKQILVVPIYSSNTKSKKSKLQPKKKKKGN